MIVLTCLLFLPLPSLAQEVDRLLATGDSLVRSGEPSRALENYEKAVQAEPSARTYLGRARAFYLMERNDRFLLDVEQALRMDSTLAEAHYMRAVYALRSQDNVKAAHHASLAIDHTAEEEVRARSHIIRGMANADLRMQEQAIRDLETGLAAGVEDVEAMRTLARLYDGVGRHVEALGLLERLTDLEPKDVGHWSNRAYELIQLERYEEALHMIDQALKLDKDEPIALSNRAYIHYKMGRDKEALQDVERSLKSYPANGHALRTRALLRLRKGDREKACEDLTLARVLVNLPDVDALVKEHCASENTPTGR